MKIRILVSAPSSFKASHVGALKKAVKQTILNLPKTKIKFLNLSNQTWELSIGIVSESKISQLNARYRKKNRPTDVLSFPPGAQPMMAHSVQSLGEIVICLEVAKTQAKLYGQTLQRELERLVVHGTLHLFGYDHELGKKQEKQMFQLQDRILKAISPKHLKT